MEMRDETAVFHENLLTRLEVNVQSLIQHIVVPIGIDQKVFDRTDVLSIESSNLEFRCTQTHVHDRARITFLKLMSSFLMICRS